MNHHRSRQAVFGSLLALAFVLAGCVDDSPLRITGTFAVTSDTCTGAAGTVQNAAGRLDIAPASREQAVYLLQLQVNNEINPQPQLNQASIPVNTSSSGDITLKEVIVSYTSKPTFSNLHKESIPIGGVLGHGGAGQTITVNVLGKNAADVLGAALSAGNSADVVLSIQVHGVEQAGGDVYSTTVTYPIHVFQSGTTCPAPDQFGFSGPCGAVGGQDGTVACCASDPACVPVAP